MRIWETFSILFFNYNVITALQRYIFPYGIQVGDSTLRDGDDEVSEVLWLEKCLFFYDTQYNGIYISTNGILCMQPPPKEDAYVDRPFPLGFSVIAPFLADIDTSRGRGAVYYRMEASMDILNQVSVAVRRGFPNTSFMPTYTVIATWQSVGRHQEVLHSSESSDRVNTFQAVLASDDTDSYALFFYPEEGLQFFGTKPKTGTGTELPARVGFSRGWISTSEDHDYVLPEQSIRNLHQQGNTGVEGLWLFHIGSQSSLQTIVPAAVNDSYHMAKPSGQNEREPSGPESPGVEDQNDDFSILSDSNSLSVLNVPTVYPKAPTLTPLQIPSQGLSHSGGSPSPKEKCGQLLPLCSQDSYCTDHPSGPCCHCRSGYYGNGRQCLPQGVPQRLNGKVSGQVFVGGVEVRLDRVNLHGYAVVGDGRAHVSISPVPEQAGWALRSVSPIIGLFSWLFALELQGHKNGFSITGAEFTHHTEMTFYPGKQNLTVTHKSQGLDSFHCLWVETFINGEVPYLLPGATVQLEPYKETYQFNHSVVTSSSLRDYSVMSENGGLEKFSYLLRQNVTFQGCPHSARAIPEFQQLNVDRVLIMYAKEGHILRYTITNTVGPVGVGLPDPDWVNPCSAGAHHCDPMALCVPGVGPDYHCQCALGYRGDGQNCFDVDECSELLDSCGPHSQCVNVPGSHHCQCDAGFELDLDWHTCVDIDECYLRRCHPLASCSNSEGSFRCQCWPGYYGDGFLCDQSVAPKLPLTLCEQHRDSLQEGLGSWGGMPVAGTFVPQCDEEGQYLPLQCHSTTGHCWCVDSRGQERTGTRTSPGTPPVNCDQPGRTADVPAPGFHTKQLPPPAAPPRVSVESLCERWRLSLEEQYGGQPSPQDYMPQCDAQGHFLPAQCYGDSTFCWCVDRDGREVVGTRSNHVVKPACLPTVISNTPQPLVSSAVASPPPAPAILYSQGQQIGSVPLNGPQVVKEKASVFLTLKDSIVVGIDYDCQENRLYWTDLAKQSIDRVRLVAGAEPETVINTGLSSPEGVAVEVKSRRLFWVDSGADRIEVSSLDGGGRKVLFDSNLVNPRAIVVDPIHGLLYWTDWDRDAPKIEISTVEGKGRKVLVKEGIALPNALTLDPTTKHLCWADAGTKKLECITADGTGRREIHSSLDYPFSLIFHGNNIYCTDWERDGIVILNKDNSNLTEEYLPRQRSHLFGITVITSHCSSGKL